MTNNANNLVDILEKTVKYLKDKGNEKARLNAEKILCEALNFTNVELYTNFDKTLTENELNSIRKILSEFDKKKEDTVMENTVRDSFQKTILYLDKKGIKESRVITTMIFSKILNVDTSLLFTKYSEMISEEEKAKIKDILKKIVVSKLPIQYIFNEQNFFGYNFYVDKNVLIPRLDTESVVEKAIELLSKMENPLVLDIGTGSGAIGITIALENRKSKVLATDISENAINIAKQNANNLQATNIKFLVSDLFKNIDFKNFDMIVSNPPYISIDEVEYMSQDTLIHEPKSALFADNKGLHFYHEISIKALEYLKDNGILLFEIGFKQAALVEKILKNSGYEDIQIGQDISGNDRWIMGVKKG